MRLHHVIGAVASAGLLGMASVGQAMPIAYEPFNYSYPGSITAGTAPDAGSSGLAGTWSLANTGGGSEVINSGSLSNPSAPTTAYGNSLQVNSGTGNGEAYVSLTVPSNFSDSSTGGTLFLSALVDLSSITAGDAQVQCSVNGVNGVNFGFNPGGADTFGMNPSSAFTRAPSTDANAVATINTPTLLVVELVYAGTDSDAAYLFVNPSQSLSTSSADVSLTGLSLTMSINRVQFFSTNSSGANTPIFDEFRVGTTFGDVIGVPEPASLGLLGTVGAATLLRRRRRAIN